MGTPEYIQYPPANGSGGVSSLNALVGDITLISGAGISIVPSGSNITISATDPGDGSVTSVALADSTGLFNITGSPVTTAGTLTLSSLQSQLANRFFAAPNGSNGAPTFRAIVSADIPTLNQNTTGTASNITASSNSTLTTLSSLSLPGAQVTGNISGSAAKWTTPRLLAGNSVDGSADVPFANKFIVQGTVDAGLSAAQFLGALTTGIVKNTTTTGVLSIAVAGDFPTLNQNTTGTASNITASSNSTLTTLSSLSLPGAQVTGNISGNSGGFTGSLSGDVTGTQSTTAIASTVVTGKLLTGYVSGSGVVSATDSILQAIQKLNGNDLIVLNDQTTTYTIVASDFNKIVRDTGSTAITFNVTSAATLGVGWHAFIKNNNTGAGNAGQLTITPATGTIDGQASLVTYPGDLRLIESDGTNFTTQLLQGGFVQYTAAGASTFTVPTKVTFAKVELWGSGGGGGSGRRGAAASARSGGSGGGGGAYVEQFVRNSDLGTSITVTIGAAATGGAAATADNTSGTVGSDGNNSTFGTLITAYAGGGGGAGTAATGSGGGGGGSLTAAVNNTGGGPLAATGGANFGGATGGTAAGGESGYGGAAGGGVAAGGAGKNGGSSHKGGAAAGSGGGISAGDAAQIGGDGGSGQGSLSGGGGAHGATSTNGTAGTAGPSALGPGTGGGGGGGSTTTTGGTGGAGGVACGGGGGGASLNGNNSGAGGASGPGLCRIYYE